MHQGWHWFLKGSELDYIVHGISCHICNGVYYPILRCMLGYNNDLVSLLISSHDYDFNSVFLCYSMVYKLINIWHLVCSCILKCAHMSLVISMIKISSLAYKNANLSSKVLFSLFSMTSLGNTKYVVYSRCCLLADMTNGLKLLYYQGNTKT